MKERQWVLGSIRRKKEKGKIIQLYYYNHKLKNIHFNPANDQAHFNHTEDCSPSHIQSTTANHPLIIDFQKFKSLL